MYKFQAASTPQCQQFVPIDVPQIGFIQVSTDSSTAGASLTPIGDTDLLLDGSVPGPVNIINFDVEPADYTRFQLKTAEGFTYILDQKLGAISVTDPNNNTLTINANGVIHSNGTSVVFTRDSQGRITQITDPAGKVLTYAYTPAGDLASFTDPTGNVTGFSYDSTHLLLDIINARGIHAAKNVFDENGRLLSSTDASGKTTKYAYDLAANHETVTDRMGNTSIYEYDDDGNIVRGNRCAGKCYQFHI